MSLAESRGSTGAKGSTASDIAGILAASEPPRLAVNFTAMLRALTVKGIGLMDVIRVVESHSVIVAKLIGLANSAWSNPVKPITTLQHACTRLGLDVVRTVSIAMCVSRSFTIGQCLRFDPTLHWLSSLIASDICAALAERYRVDTGTARAAGLMHNIGILWLADRFPQQTSSALERWDPAAAQSLDGVMAGEVGVGYFRAGSILVNKLGLPDTLKDYFTPPHAGPAAASPTTPFNLVLTAAGIASCVLHPDRPIEAVITAAPYQPEDILTRFEDTTARIELYQKQAGLLTAG